MKKVLSKASALIALVLALSLMGIPAFAADAENTATVYVTICDATGKLAVAQESVAVTDVDNDGALTVNDALYAAHESKYEGGAAAGYASSVGQYGLAIDKLWGTANGGSYGYYVNNASAMGLADPVEDGDYINAYVFTDLTAWSDTYCFFDTHTVSGKQGDTVTLTLSMAGFDEQYNPITSPVEGATVTVDGSATNAKTDAEGKVTVTLDKAGTHIISAVSDTLTLVPPVCVATVEADTVTTSTPSSDTEVVEDKGCGSSVSVMSMSVVALAGAVTAFALKRKRNNEK
ncbi:MAG: hypothetical protein IJY08_04230 [Clostridia bacterium]|nr:hypothetical protein [Clostridia bacterium]